MRGAGIQGSSLSLKSLRGLMGADGDVYSFGDDLYGQCGHGRDKNEWPSPEKIQFFVGRSVVQASAASFLLLACLARRLAPRSDPGGSM